MPSSQRSSRASAALLADSSSPGRSATPIWDPGAYNSDGSFAASSSRVSMGAHARAAHSALAAAHGDDGMRDLKELALAQLTRMQRVQVIRRVVYAVLLFVLPGFSIRCLDSFAAAHHTTHATSGAGVLGVMMLSTIAYVVLAIGWFTYCVACDAPERVPEALAQNPFSWFATVAHERGEMAVPRSMRERLQAAKCYTLLLFGAGTGVCGYAGIAMVSFWTRDMLHWSCYSHMAALQIFVALSWVIAIVAAVLNRDSQIKYLRRTMVGATIVAGLAACVATLLVFVEQVCDAATFVVILAMGACYWANVAIWRTLGNVIPREASTASSIFARVEREEFNRRPTRLVAASTMLVDAVLECIILCIVLGSDWAPELRAVFATGNDATASALWALGFVVCYALWRVNATVGQFRESVTSTALPAASMLGALAATLDDRGNKTAYVFAVVLASIAAVAFAVLGFASFIGRLTNLHWLAQAEASRFAARGDAAAYGTLDAALQQAAAAATAAAAAGSRGVSCGQPPTRRSTHGRHASLNDPADDGSVPLVAAEASSLSQRSSVELPYDDGASERDARSSQSRPAAPALVLDDTAADERRRSSTAPPVERSGTPPAYDADADDGASPDASAASLNVVAYDVDAAHHDAGRSCSGVSQPSLRDTANNSTGEEARAASSVVSSGRDATEDTTTPRQGDEVAYQ